MSAAGAKIETICRGLVRGRVLERVRGVDVEEAAAVGAEHLDRDLGSDRARGDGLRRAFERRRLDEPASVCGTPRPKHEREDDGERQQHEEGDAGQVDPEVADAPDRARAKRGSRDRDAMPVAAETKFCTVSPAIWVRWLMVVSPP